MKDALREETQFWLVTPKASLAGVSGLDADVYKRQAYYCIEWFRSEAIADID